jgi:hypothetical protein
MKLKKRYVAGGLLLLVALYFGPVTNMYTISEKSAIRNSHPNLDGEKVFEKEFGNKKVVIWNTAFGAYAKLITRQGGIFYRSEAADEIGAPSPDGKMNISWSAWSNGENNYDTLLAAEILDNEIVKVVVTNETDRDKSLSLSEVKELSNVFVEMEVINGYAGQYLALPNSDAGGFIFRGLNAEGEVVSFR